jgi:hypothetical protein
MAALPWRSYHQTGDTGFHQVIKIGGVEAYDTDKANNVRELMRHDLPLQLAY